MATTHVLHKGVWRVVCLAAINAMDMGRKAAMKIQIDQHEQQQQQQATQQQPPVPTRQRLITDLLQPAALTADQQQHQAQVRQHQLLQIQQQQQQQQIAAARLAQAKQQAASRFWELLQDFIALQAAPRSWLTQVASDHPFLRVTDNHLGVHCIAAAPNVG
jgi:hypothetical protein